jgi:tRNA-dihydrouridine synthase A
MTFMADMGAMSARTHRFCVAPQMDWTDRHCRYFHRLLSKHARVYSEMLTVPALIHGKRAQLLGFDPSEHPVALQLGGSDPVGLAAAARIGEDWGYDEINLNVGCPSDRVQVGSFGACLMAEPALVADCVAAMRAAVQVPVTVKCRIGIDDQDSEADLDRFIDTVASAGCDTFIVHARKAWLKGLSPKENREIPPLDYARVARLKARWPELTIVLNGGICSIDEAEQHLQTFDGVMLGRAAYHTPFILAEIDRRIFGDARPVITRGEVLRQLIPYIEHHVALGGRPYNVLRHVLGLYHGQPRARAFRRLLSEEGPRATAGADLVRAALALVEGREYPAAAE